MVSGWGGRIRTSVWRNQNPLPYRLATPQRAARLVEPGGAAAFAAIASGVDRSESDERVGVLVCGANADLAAFA